MPYGHVARARGGVAPGQEGSCVQASTLAWPREQVLSKCIPYGPTSFYAGPVHQAWACVMPESGIRAAPSPLLCTVGGGLWALAGLGCCAWGFWTSGRGLGAPYLLYTAREVPMQ